MRPDPVDETRLSSDALRMRTAIEQRLFAPPRMPRLPARRVRLDTHLARRRTRRWPLVVVVLLVVVLGLVAIV